MKQLIRKGVAHAIAKIVPRGILTDEAHSHIYLKAGYNIVRDHFYTPIPNTKNLDPALWTFQSEMIGVDVNKLAMMSLLNEVSEQGFIQEFKNLPPVETPYSAYTNPGGFGGVDGALTYAMIRKLKPKRIIEVGSGQSTLCMKSAISANRNGATLTSIDPNSPDYLIELQNHEFQILKNRVELVPTDYFNDLQSGDILFIDSSHVVRIGGDVIYEILEIIPRLTVGCLIHIHDIFLPHHYSKHRIVERRVFWTEQYLLQAFLAFNKSFEILWSSAMMDTWNKVQIRGLFPDVGDCGSIWLRRVA